ncbi:ORF2 [Dioscorea bacilliform TR virus]|uniref:ORF2 n=1 Tax=Dioscorea bacilliform TR virus TaxID=2169728 RepID=A0A1J0AHH0_9VIRU|nr:ORF2 [Dioscorea bacilliform TR virus]APB42234.1 ORF2 [Dioscorea bacilliform TR virus]
MSEELKKALQSTESIEPPSIGYVKPHDYQGKLAGAIAAVQKQNNTLIQLQIQQFEKLSQIYTAIKDLKQQASPSGLSTEVLDQVIDKLGKLSIQSKVPEKQGKLLVWKDPCLIYKEELEKL